MLATSTQSEHSSIEFHKTKAKVTTRPIRTNGTSLWIQLESKQQSAQSARKCERQCRDWISLCIWWLEIWVSRESFRQIKRPINIQNHGTSWLLSTLTWKLLNASSKITLLLPFFHSCLYSRESQASTLISFKKIAQSFH